MISFETKLPIETVNKCLVPECVSLWCKKNKKVKRRRINWQIVQHNTYISLKGPPLPRRRIYLKANMKLSACCRLCRVRGPQRAVTRGAAASSSLTSRTWRVTPRTTPWAPPPWGSSPRRWAGAGSQLELSVCVQVKAKGPKEEQVNAITGFSSQIMSEYHKYK